MPSYSGRLLGNVEDTAEALRLLEAGPGRHLVVMDADVHKLSASRKARLDLVKAVTFAATREVNVHAVRPCSGQVRRNRRRPEGTTS